MDLKALQKKAELALEKKKTVCCDNVFKDMNFVYSMPLDSGHIAKVRAVGRQLIFHRCWHQRECSSA